MDHYRFLTTSPLSGKVLAGWTSAANIDDKRGTLAVRESRPGSFLRLSKDSKGGRLQFFYRWIIGVGRQATVDEVTLDAGRQSVELIKNNKQKSLPFADFAAVGMREFSAIGGLVGGGGHTSVWHLELVPVKGSRLLLLTSESDHRQKSFEQTAAVAKSSRYDHVATRSIRGGWQSLVTSVAAQEPRFLLLSV